MNEKMKKAWKWIKEHKVEIGLTAFTVVGGVVLCKSITKPVSEGGSKLKVSDIIPEKKILPDIGIGTVTYYAGDKNGLGMEFMMDGITLDKMGELGEQIRVNVPDPIPDNECVWALINIRPYGENF